MLRRVLMAIALSVACGAAFAARQGGPIPVQLPLFPGNNWWNTDISAAPVDANSNAFINFIGATTGLHPDFGGDAGAGDIYGFPFLIVDGAQPLKTVTFVDFPLESDGVGMPFYPIPDEAATTPRWVEGGQPGNVDQTDDADRHMLIVDKTNNLLFELYNVWFNGTNWEAGSGAFFDMNTNDRRPEGWTSADAAGLAILPGLVRYDEVVDPGEIGHAFRVTVDSTNGHVYPASHDAGSTLGALPMGARLRLKASKDISGFPDDVEKIFRAFKKYGLIVADNGSDMYISGVYDTRWDNGVLNPKFNMLKASDFEVVELGWQPPVAFLVTLPPAVGVNVPVNGTVTAFAPDYTVATGYLGTIQFSSDGAATLPANYTFTVGDAGTHPFTGFSFPTAGTQTVTATDMLDATKTGSQTVSVGPRTPSGLVATAATAALVNLSWDASDGATEYQIERMSAGSGGYVSHATTSMTSYPDMTSIAAGATYVYRVSAVDGALTSSLSSIPDAATTFFFTDDPVVPNASTIKALHLTQLRQAVNVFRAAAGLGAASFPEPIVAGSVRIKAAHFQEVQDALDEARTMLNLIPTGHSDEFYDIGTTPVRAANVQESRDAVK